jgi:coenzyme PQQ synthesis protein D (PqqD)
MKLPLNASIPQQVISRTVGEEIVILDLTAGTYFGLDAVGAYIWHHISDGKTFVEICDLVCGEYDVKREVVEHDILSLIEELKARGLLLMVD